MLVASRQIKIKNKGGSNISLIILTINYLKYERLIITICLKLK